MTISKATKMLCEIADKLEDKGDMGTAEEIDVVIHELNLEEKEETEKVK